MNKVGRFAKKVYQKHEVLRVISIAGIFLFALMPLIILAFNIKGNDLAFVFNDDKFYDSLKNTLIYTLVSALITTILAVITAYLLHSSSIKHKNIIVVILTLGMLVPTLSIGLGFRLLLNNNGFFNKIFKTSIDGIGMPGLILGSIVSSFPAAFLIIYDALKYEDKGPYDAASIMGIKRISTFFKLTLPYLKVAIISSFFASFTLIFSDYGIPMELSGKVNTLPLYLYDQILSLFKYGRGSIAGLVILIPALLSFVFDIIFKDNSSEEKQKRLIRSSKLFNALSLTVILLIAFFMFIPQLTFIILSFVKSFPNNMSFTFNNIIALFTNRNGLGVMRYLGNSLLMSLGVGLIGTIVSYLLGYLAVRKKGSLGKAVDLLSLSTIAIPGIVLGIGYIYLFKGVSFFYDSILILIVVNVFHFLGSPYLMAKNCLTKISKEYEVVGETLGISKFKIIFKVLIPSSASTLIEMFSYFFLNSMITISAVAFLCNADNQPLSILISTYEASQNYEMQSAISLLLLVVNISFKTIFTKLFDIIHFIKKKGGKEGMALTRYQFELLTFLERNGKKRYSQRYLSDMLTFSLGNINKLLKELTELDYIEMDASQELSLTEKGLKALEPYRVRKAIILAAGFGSRLAPVTLDIPKPLVKVNGTRIIDSLLDALVQKGITNIFIVRGYKREQFDDLLKKYPSIQFVDNENFNVMNNISSAMKVIDSIDRCYICEADLLINNPDIIRKYEFSSNYLGARVKETDDWCFKKVNGYVGKYTQGGEDCYQAYGISYWNEEDSAKLRNDIRKHYNSRGGKETLWENVPLKYFKKNYKIEIRTCFKSDIIEIDNFSELVSLDESYANYPKHEEFN
ncbi:MAG TPA: hypothetical protein DCY93_03230 [Firmicutes bacterium]|nr:hypothetical protein [Bacillota bacterium]